MLGNSKFAPAGR